jgi:hypothetical protein
MDKKLDATPPQTAAIADAPVRRPWPIITAVVFSDGRASFSFHDAALTNLDLGRWGALFNLECHLHMVKRDIWAEEQKTGNEVGPTGSPAGASPPTSPLSKE